MSFQVVKSQALSTVSPRKLQEALEATLRSCADCQEKALGAACIRCRTINMALHRYSDANIPVSYWNIEMDENFQGGKILMDIYKKVTDDLKKSYSEGVSYCLAGSHGSGKQLSLKTELPTPSGFTKLSELQVGDQLFDEQGNICNVIKLHPIDLAPESYEIEFDDGTKVEACADHQWLTWTLAARRAFKAGIANEHVLALHSTKEIFLTQRVDKYQAANHSISCIEPVKYPEKNLLIDPYTLGCWLGDGTTTDDSIECADQEILDEIAKSGYQIKLYESSIERKSKSCKYAIGKPVFSESGRRTRRLKIELKKLGVLKNKHIPDIYLTGSFEQRLALLQGLLDTDGCCSSSGRIEYCSVLPRLAEQVCQLVRSFGIKAKVHKSYLYGKECKDRYRINFTADLPVFRLKRKLANIRTEKTQINRTKHKYIVNVKRIDPVPMRCITVNSPSHLFLITRSFIPTHNTMTVCNILKRVVVKGYSAHYATLNDMVFALVSSSQEEKTLARNQLLLTDFLVIDEFDPRFMGTETAAELFGRILEDIFRTRAQNKMPILMCSNSPNVVESFNGAIKQSISSLMNYVQQIPILGADFRKQEKKKREPKESK